jgi:hypothetical protein
MPATANTGSGPSAPRYSKGAKLTMNIEKKIRLLRAIFIMASVLLMMCVIATPIVLGSRILPAAAFILDEDLIESLLIAALFALAGAIFALYRRELRSLQRQLGQVSGANAVLKDRLTDAFRYIGTVNVQLQEIHSVFAEVIRYPESRSEFKRLLADTAAKALCTVDKDWMLIRIVDRANLKTRIEHWQARGGVQLPNVCVSNRAAIGQTSMPSVEVVRSHRENTAYTAVCVFPPPRLHREERFLMEAVAAEMEMIYSVFASRADAKNKFEDTPVAN